MVYLFQYQLYNETTTKNTVLKSYFDKLKEVKVNVVLNVSIPAGNYLPKVNNKNTRTRCEICSKLTIKIPERRHWFS